MRQLLTFLIKVILRISLISLIIINAIATVVVFIAWLVCVIPYWLSTGRAPDFLEDFWNWLWGDGYSNLGKIPKYRDWITDCFEITKSTFRIISSVFCATIGFIIINIPFILVQAFDNPRLYWWYCLSAGLPIAVALFFTWVSSETCDNSYDEY